MSHDLKVFRTTCLTVLKVFEINLKFKKNYKKLLRH